MDRSRRSHVISCPANTATSYTSAPLSVSHTPEPSIRYWITSMQFECFVNCSVDPNTYKRRCLRFIDLECVVYGLQSLASGVGIWVSRDFASSAFGFALDYSQTPPAAAVNSLDDFDSSSTIIYPCDRLTGKKKIHKQTLHIHTRIQPRYFRY
jgi:hypothetical protein